MAATQFVQLALNGAVPIIKNYDVIYDKTKETIKRARPGKSRGRDQQGDRSDDDMDRNGRPYRTVERVQARGRDGYYDVYATRDGETVYRGEYNARDPGGVEEIPRAFPPPGADEYHPGGTADEYFQGGRARSANPSERYVEEDRRNRYRPRGRRYDSESESSISPQPRNRRRGKSDAGRDLAVAGAAGAGAYAANRDLRDSPQDWSAGQSQVSKRDDYRDRKQDNDDDSGDDSDSSSILSSSEDERQKKKMRHKAMITAGLATVATIHAASGVYASIGAREARYKAVKEGKLSEKEAKREANKARMQDLAALGIAALGIKGAVGKWKATTEHHRKYRDHKKTWEERHQKRLEKQMKSSGSGADGHDDNRMQPYNGPYSGGGQRGGEERPGYNRTFSTSEPDLHYGGRGDGRYDDRRYNDGNPYATYGQR